MRRSEITKELIELSKRAKELGFPQDVEEGDWICYIERETNHLYLLTCPEIRNGYLSEEDYKGNYNLHVYKDSWFLILSFSRCMEWLRGKGYFIQMYEPIPNRDMRLTFAKEMAMGRTVVSESIHELGAKAVVKILEEQCLKKSKS